MNLIPYSQEQDIELREKFDKKFGLKSPERFLLMINSKALNANDVEQEIDDIFQTYQNIIFQNGEYKIISKNQHDFLAIQEIIAYGIIITQIQDFCNELLDLGYLKEDYIFYDSRDKQKRIFVKDKNRPDVKYAYSITPGKSDLNISKYNFLTNPYLDPFLEKTENEYIYKLQIENLIDMDSSLGSLLLNYLIKIGKEIS